MLFFGRADTIGEEGPETNTLSTFLDSRCQPLGAVSATGLTLGGRAGRSRGQVRSGRQRTKK
jgi:hypothetical protein